MTDESSWIASEPSVQESKVHGRIWTTAVRASDSVQDCNQSTMDARNNTITSISGILVQLTINIDIFFNCSLSFFNIISHNSLTVIKIKFVKWVKPFTSNSYTKWDIILSYNLRMTISMIGKCQQIRAWPKLWCMITSTAWVVVCCVVNTFKLVI